MIIDRIKNIEYYETILPGLKNGLNTLRQLPSQEVGRYEFEGGFLMIQEGTTKPMSEGPQICGCSDHAAGMRGARLGGI